MAARPVTPTEAMVQDSQNLSMEEYYQEQLQTLIELDVEFSKKYEFLLEFAKTLGVDSQCTGSITEGAFMARCVQNMPAMLELEFDVMVNFATLPEHTRDVIESVEGKPGFVRLPYDAPYDAKFRQILSEKFAPARYISPLVMRSETRKSVESMESVKEAWEMLSASISEDFYSVHQFATTMTTAEHQIKVFSRDNNEMYDQISFDVVPALRLLFWPQDVTPWTTRDRRFPPPETIQSIADAGCQIVPRSSPGGDEDTEWRLSFSTPETALARLRSPEQQRAYYFFKMLFYRYLKGVESSEAGKKPLFSYIMKTTMLWACEEYPPEDPLWQRLEQSVMMLLSRLETSLQSGHVPHYFIPEINLIEMTGTDVRKKAVKIIKDLQENNIFMRGLHALDIDEVVEYASRFHSVSKEMNEGFVNMVEPVLAAIDAKEKP